MTELTRRLQDARARIATLQRETHALQIEVVRQNEVESRFNQRSSQIDVDLAEIAAQEEEQRMVQQEAEQQFEQLDMELAELQGGFEDGQTLFLQREAALAEARDKLRELERGAQEALFAEKTGRARIEELRRSIATASQQAAQVADSLASGQAELTALESGSAHEGLQELLDRRTSQEKALSDARHELDQVAQQLRHCRGVAHGFRAQPAAAARPHHRDAAEGAGRAPEPGAVRRSPGRDRRRRSRVGRQARSRT